MSDWETLAGIYGGFGEARVLHEAVLAGIFDVTAEPRTAGEVATSTGLDPDACGLLLDALCGMELLVKSDGRYRNTELSDRYLREEAEETQVPIIRFNARQWDHWGRLGEALRTGQPVRPPDMYQEDPDQLRDFILGMRSIALGRGDAERLPEVLDLSGADRLLDLGCGPGTYSRIFLEAYLDLEATLLDLPATLEITREVVAGWPKEVQGRVQLVEADFHEDPLPDGHDVAWVSNIVHSETPEANRRLLDRIHDALEPGGRIVLKDHWLDETGTRPRRGATFHMTMLLFTGGRCYRYGEIREMLEAAGFVGVEQRSMGAEWPQSLVLARKG